MTHKVIQAKRLIEAFLALMLGRRVPVHWGSCASIDNDKEVHLPVPQTGDAAEIALLTRLAVHEGGHVLETEAGFADRLTREEIGVFNALEDPRMEHRQVRRYPGASLILSRGLEEMLENIESHLEAILRQTPARALHLDLLLRGFLAVAPHGPFARRAPGILEQLACHIDEAQRAAVDEAVARLPSLHTSREAEDAARVLLGRLREERPPSGEAGNGDGPNDSANASDRQEPQPDEAPDAVRTDPPQQQQQEQQHEDGAGGSQVNSQAQEEGAAGCTGDPQDCEADACQNTGEAGGGSGQASAVPCDSGDPLDLGVLLRETLAARQGGQEGDPVGSDDGHGAPVQPLSDEELARVRWMLASADTSVPLEELVRTSLMALATNEAAPAGDGAGGDGAGMGLARGNTEGEGLAPTRLQGVQSHLVTVLQRELQERRRRPTRAAATGGRVMTQRFWRLGALGDTRVFVRKRDACGIDAAATVLLDSSYSMKEQLGVAAQVAMAFSLAMQRLGVRTRVVHFPGAQSVTQTLQGFGESSRHCVHRCAALVADGGTPIGAATAAETPLLMQQRRLKNILVLVTDDAPGDKETLTAALARAQELGVLVVGVGIACDIRPWVANAVMVRDVTELPAALTGLFRQSISDKLVA